MNSDDVAWLCTEEGGAATARAAALLATGSELAAIRALGRSYEPKRVRAAVALARGRQTAAAKFPDAARLFCDREAAEQASHHLVARHLAARFAGCARVADLGCGMGGDALAIAEHTRVLAVDRDPARLAMLEANAAARGLAHRIQTVEADIGMWEPPADVDAVWCDPARREAAGRRLRPEAWSPPLSRALALAARVPAAGIKLAPGIDLDLLPSDGEVEFVSMDRGLRAAVVWLGRLARAPRTASVLPGGSLAGDPNEHGASLDDPGAYVFELDPAVGRAGLVDRLAREIGAWKLDPEIAYLSADKPVETPFGRRLRVRRWFPFSERRLLEALRAHAVPRVEVARRGSPIDTNALERRLNRRLAGGSGPPAVVLLTRVRGEHVAIVCDRD